MSRRRRIKKKKSRKRLVYGVIAVTFILLCFLTYFSLQQSNQPDQTDGDNATPPQAPQAAIVDHLSFRNETTNQTFVSASKNILKNAGFAVDYYGGNEVNITFYKHLFTHGYSLIVLRVHSAMIEDLDSLGLFTSEPLDESKFNTFSAPYYDDVVKNRIIKAYFTEGDPIQYFGIAPGFIEKYGNFKNTTIIIMGCDGLKNNKTAQAFINKGAKVYISWDGPVGVDHTDQATIQLLQSLLKEKQTIKKAVEEISPDPVYNSRLLFYPEGAGDYRITSISSGLTSSVLVTSTVCVRSKKTLIDKLLNY